MRKLAEAAVLISFASGAHAAPILSISGEGAAAALAAEQAFLAAASGYTTESFESHTPGAQSLSLSTSVGTFTSDLAGVGGLCNSGSYSCDGGLAVLDDVTSPFNGRFATPDGAGNDNWLDSMDAQQLTISPLAGMTAIGFYMTDPNDAGGRFDIGGPGFLFEDIFQQSLGNGRQFYITIFDRNGLGNISIFSNNGDDGYGIDNVTVARSVPEPGTLALLGAGLLSLSLTRRRHPAV